jgi:hypothetical protein
VKKDGMMKLCLREEGGRIEEASRKLAGRKVGEEEKLGKKLCVGWLGWFRFTACRG